jgi:glutathionylspermidine synthase
MERRRITPRPVWEEKVRQQGLTFYMTDNQPYWYESACYVFTAEEIDRIEQATYELNNMCLEAVEYAVQNRLFDSFLIPPDFQSFVAASWERDEHTLYGRFDFAFDGENLKLLEYNADTPTGLIEASVAQWHWYQDIFRGNESVDQFNSIHERLIEAWQAVFVEFGGTMYFTSLGDHEEDYMTVHYLRDTAVQAGYQTEFLPLRDIGWSERLHQFVDLHDRPIRNIFKLYPWEWLVREPFGRNLLRTSTHWLEAPWKMFLSNKALLPMLWELFPNSPYLLPATFEPLPGSYVRKPLLGREGANMQVVLDGQLTLDTEGPYSGPYVYQEYFPLRQFDGAYPIIGSWLVNGWACGIGIREEDQLVTTDQARFVPHYFTTTPSAP